MGDVLLFGLDAACLRTLTGRSKDIYGILGNQQIFDLKKCSILLGP